jgi:hypothetical protein
VNVERTGIGTSDTNEELDRNRDPGPAVDSSRQQPHDPDLFQTVAPDEPLAESAESIDQSTTPTPHPPAGTDEAVTLKTTSATPGKRQPARRRRGQGEGVPSRSTEGDAGADLERRVARLEFAEGALARLRVPVFVDAEAGRDILTDLDVLSLDFDSRIRLSRSTLECKSGRGQSGEGDRLLWLSGLGTLLHIERAVLVRQTITRRGRALATALGLQILDIPTLSVRELAHAWLPDRFAHIDGPACLAAESRADVQLRGLGHIPSELVAFLRHQSLLAPSHRSLAALVALRRAVEHGGVLPTPTRSVLSGHALQALALAALQDAATLDTVPAPQLRRRIELALTVGSPDDDHVLSVLGRADQVMGRVLDGVHRAYIEQGASRIDVPTPSLRQLVAVPPDWVQRYLDLVQRLRANPAISRQLPQMIELACFDALLDDTAYRAAAFDHLFTVEHRSLLLGCLRLLGDLAGAQVADTLAPITQLDYGRFAPALPDRTAKQASTSTPATPPPVRRVQ